jgi:hypothetical protein
VTRLALAGLLGFGMFAAFMAVIALGLHFLVAP